MITALHAVSVLLFIYYLLSNLVYLGLLILALFASANHRMRISSMRLAQLRESPFTPPITIIVPAHNEETTIVDSIRSLLALDYPELEIVVVNDGSVDHTLERLSAAYDLGPAHLLYVAEVESAPVRGLYTSMCEHRLLVVDKHSGGSKADAINAGFNVATSPYVCVIDADSILERDALLRIMSRVFTDPENIVAVGGIIRALNGCAVVNGAVSDIRVPRTWVETIQVIEYLRAFLVGREGWAALDMLPIISGAFGVFRTDLVRRIGGFRAAAIGEDLDLIVRMHRNLIEAGEAYRIAFVPDPTCWTEVPADLRSLARQRARWQKGLIDTLWPNRDMLFRPRYKRLGTVMLPYLWIFEFLAPVIEVVGYATVVAAAFLGALSTRFLYQFSIFGYAFATLLSIGSVLLEEFTFRRYNRRRDVARLILFCFLEHFPYRQMNMIWRLQGMWQYLRGDLGWKHLQRRGFRPRAGETPPQPQSEPVA